MKSFSTSLVFFLFLFTLGTACGPSATSNNNEPQDQETLNGKELKRRTTLTGTPIITGELIDIFDAGGSFVKREIPFHGNIVPLEPTPLLNGWSVRIPVLMAVKAGSVISVKPIMFSDLVSFQYQNPDFKFGDKIEFQLSGENSNFEKLKPLK